jgi:hypothetical protein
MLRPSPRPVSSYLDKPLRTLYDACRELGQDDNGRGCASCSLWHLLCDDPDDRELSEIPLLSQVGIPEAHAPFETTLFTQQLAEDTGAAHPAAG